MGTGCGSLFGSADDVMPLLHETQVPTTVVVSTLDLPGTEMHHEIFAAFRAGLNADLARAARENDLLWIESLPTTHAMHLDAPGRMADLIRRAAAPR